MDLSIASMIFGSFHAFWIFCLWLACSAMAAWAAQEKGRSGACWFVLALACSPIFAILCLIAVPARRSAGAVGLDGVRAALEAL